MRQVTNEILIKQFFTLIYLDNVILNLFAIPQQILFLISKVHKRLCVIFASTWEIKRLLIVIMHSIGAISTPAVKTHFNAFNAFRD